MTDFSVKLEDEVRSMSALAEASGLLRRVAEPVPAGDTAKAAMLRAWRQVNAFCGRTGIPSWSFNRVRDVWRPDPRIRVRADEINTLRALMRRRSQERQEKVARDDADDLRQRIARLEQILLSSDADFHRENISALREMDGKGS